MRFAALQERYLLPKQLAPLGTADIAVDARRAVLRARKRVIVFSDVVAAVLHPLPTDSRRDLCDELSDGDDDSPLWLAACDAMRLVDGAGGRAALPAFALQMFAMNSLRAARNRVCDRLLALAKPSANIVCKAIRDAAEQHTHAEIELDERGAPRKSLLGVGVAGECTVYRLLTARQISLDDGDALLTRPSQSATMRQLGLVREVQNLIGVPLFFGLLDDALIELGEAAAAAAAATGGGGDAESILLVPLDSQIRHTGSYDMLAYYEARSLYAYALPEFNEAELRHGVLVVVQGNSGIESTFVLELRSHSERADFVRAITCARLQALAVPRAEPFERRLLGGEDVVAASLVARERGAHLVPLLHAYRDPVRGSIVVLVSDEMGTCVPNIVEHMLRYKTLCLDSQCESAERFDQEMRGFFDLHDQSLLNTPRQPALAEHALAIRRTLRYFCLLLGRMATGDIDELLPVLPQLLNLAIGERTIASGVGKALHEVVGDFVLDLCALSSLRVSVLVYLWLNAQCLRDRRNDPTPDSASRRHARERSTRATQLKGRAEAAFVAMKLQHEPQGAYLVRLKNALMQSHNARQAMLQLVDYSTAIATGTVTPAAAAAASSSSSSSGATAAAAATATREPLVDFRAVDSTSVVVMATPDGEDDLADLPDYAVLLLIEREKTRRLAIFDGEIDFVLGLVAIADRLVALQHDASSSAASLPERRKTELRAELGELNKALAPSRDSATSSDDIFLPMLSEAARVLAVSTLPDTLFVFQTKERAPFLCHIEYVHDTTIASQRNTPAYSGRVMGTLLKSTMAEHVRKALDGAAPVKLERVGEVERHPLMPDFAAVPPPIVEPPAASAFTAGVHSATSAVTAQIDSAATDAFNYHAVRELIKSTSPYARLPRWTAMSLIVKSNDDLAQEAFAMQLMRCLREIWHADGIDVNLITYHVMAVAPGSGFIETCHGALSVHALKKRQGSSGASLKQILVNRCGSLVSDDAQRALQNFVRSLAAVSIACYLLQIKDRHNGNILIDDEFNVIHIDFGFFLTSSPANAQYETGPFKLTEEYLELLGGLKGRLYEQYIGLCMEAYMSARRHHQQLVQLVEAMRGAPFTCFLGPGFDESLVLPTDDAESFVSVRQRADPAGLVPPPGVDDDDDRYFLWLCDRHRVASRQLIDRFQLQRTERQAALFVGDLVQRAYWSQRTYQYDLFQWWTNGIFY